MAAVGAVLTGPAAARELATALTADPKPFASGRRPRSAGWSRLARARVALPEPACAGCRRTGKPLTRSPSGGVCRRCWDRQQTTACARCGLVKLVRGHDEQHRPLCRRCADWPHAAAAGAGGPGASRSAAGTGTGHLRCLLPATGRDLQPLRPPPGVRVGRRCRADLRRLHPAATAICAHCGQQRPPTARWPEGPVCDPCYQAALQRRGVCASCRAPAASSTRPARTPSAAPSAPGSRSPTPASIAGSRTSSTNAAAAIAVRCVAAPRHYCAAAETRSPPNSCRSTSRSSRPAPRAAH